MTRTFNRQFQPRSIAELQRKFRQAEIDIEDGSHWKPFDPLTLSTLQQAALLMMRESQVRRAVVARLLEDAQDKPALPDFIVLRDLNLAEWKDGKRMHQLTGPGRVAAERLEQALCKRFGIHLLLQGGDQTWEQACTCSCGEWFRSFKRGRGTTFEIWRSHGRHVESVTAVSTIYEAMKPVERERA